MSNPNHTTHLDGKTATMQAEIIAKMQAEIDRLKRELKDANGRRCGACLWALYDGMRCQNPDCDECGNRTPSVSHNTAVSSAIEERDALGREVSVLEDELEAQRESLTARTNGLLARIDDLKAERDQLAADLQAQMGANARAKIEVLREVLDDYRGDKDMAAWLNADDKRTCAKICGDKIKELEGAQ